MLFIGIIFCVVELVGTLNHRLNFGIESSILVAQIARL
jgi:hypothetical protein